MPPNLINEIYKDLEKSLKTKKVEKTVRFIGLRE